MDARTRVTVRADHPPLWMTVGEVAYSLGVAVSTVRMWVADGCVPSPRYCGNAEAFGEEWWDEFRRGGVCIPGSYPVERLPITLPGRRGKAVSEKRAARLTKNPGKCAPKGPRVGGKDGAR